MDNDQVTQETSRRIIVSITGASGAILGIRTLEVLKQMGIETHLIISPAARTTIAQETDWTTSDVSELARQAYDFQDIGARIASGSYATTGMVVIPCSVKTLSAIANSYSDDLISRAADVTLKEGRPLVLVFRETPLHRGHLRLMSLAAEAGAVIFPPVPAFYTRPQSGDDIVNQIVGRVLARMGIANEVYKAWKA